MIGLLLLALLFILLFGGMGFYISPLFFILLVIVLILSLGGGYGYRDRWR